MSSSNTPSRYVYENGKHEVKEPYLSRGFTHYRIFANSVKLRRYVTLTGPNNANHVTTYARYLYQVHLWETKKELIPEGMEVDHINDNFLDDRIENLQLLTRYENIRKRDRVKYGNCPITDELISRVRNWLSLGLNVHAIAKNLQKGQGFVRYLVTEFLPEFAARVAITYESREDRSIHDMIAAGKGNKEIAEEIGCDSSTVSRIRAKYFSNLTAEVTRKEMRDRIEEAVRNGRTDTDIANELGCQTSNISYYIKTHMPDVYAQRRENDEDRKEIYEKIFALAKDLNVKYGDISKKSGAVPPIVHYAISRYLPEYTEVTRDGKRLRIAKQKIADGENEKDVAEWYGVTKSALRNILCRNIDNWDLPIEDKKKLFVSLMREGYPQYEAANEACIAPSMATKWCAAECPEESTVARIMRACIGQGCPTVYEDICEAFKKLIPTTTVAALLQKDERLKESAIYRACREMGIDYPPKN